MDVPDVAYFLWFVIKMKGMERCVTIWTKENDIILDFTMGSGTTGVAAMKLGRKFIGIEKDKEWFEIANRRLNEVE